MILRAKNIMNFNGKGRALAYASSRNDYHAHRNRYCSSVGDVAWRARGGATPDHWMGMKHAPSRQFTPLANLKLQHMSRSGSKNFYSCQKLPDSKRLAFAGLQTPSLTSRSARQIDPSADVSTRKKREFSPKRQSAHRTSCFRAP